MNKLQHLQYLNFRKPSRYADNITAIQSKPSLDLNFARNKSLIDNVTGNNLVTFTRTSGGTFVDSNGVLRSAVTNLALYSQTLNNPVWNLSGTGATITATTDIAAPDGSMTAWTFTTSGASGTLQYAPVLTAGINYTGSFWIRRRSGTGTVNIRVGDNVNTPLTGVTSTWQRFSFTSVPSTTIVRIGIGLSGIADSVDLWGAQLEQSSTMGEYVPTGATINSAPRFDHNPTTGESLGLLVEEQRTNNFLRSDFSAGWLFTNASFTGTTTAPDGTNAGQLLNDSNSGAAGYAYQGVSVTNGQAYSLSCFVKASGKTTILFQNFTQAGAVTFTLTGSGSTGSASGTFSSASINAFGNGWYRCTVVYTASSTQTVNIGFSTNDSPFTGDAFYLWGAQLEVGVFPTSYIPTTTSAATRNADIASITGTNFSSWYNQGEGTVFAEVTVPQLGRSARLVVIDAGSTTDMIDTTVTGANAFAIEAVAGGVYGGSSLTANTITANAIQKTAATYSTGLNETACLNGGTVASANVTLPSVSLTTMRLGYQANFAAMLNGTIRRLTYFPQRISNANLQRITQ